MRLRLTFDISIAERTAIGVGKPAKRAEVKALVVDAVAPIERLEYSSARVEPAWVRFGLGFDGLGDLQMIGSIGDTAHLE